MVAQRTGAAAAESLSIQISFNHENGWNAEENDDDLSLWGHPQLGRNQSGLAVKIDYTLAGL